MTEGVVSCQLTHPGIFCRLKREVLCRRLPHPLLLRNQSCTLPYARKRCGSILNQSLLGRQYVRPELVENVGVTGFENDVHGCDIKKRTLLQRDSRVYSMILQTRSHNSEMRRSQALIKSIKKSQPGDQGPGTTPLRTTLTKTSELHKRVQAHRNNQSGLL